MPNKKFIRIEGDCLFEIEEVVRKQSSASAFIEAVKTESGITTGIMPRDCIYHSRGKFVPGSEGATGVYVIEKEPKPVNLTYKNSGRGGNTAQKTLRISLPWVLFFIKIRGDVIGNIYPACSKNKITSVDDPIYVLPLHNIYSGGHGYLCTGDMRAPKESPLHIRIMALIKTFYQSEFNLDLVPNHIPRPFRKDNMQCMQGWAKATEENPFIALADETDYEPHSKPTFSSLVSYISDNNSGV